MNRYDKTLFVQFIHAVNIVRQFDRFVQRMEATNPTEINSQLQFDPNYLNFDGSTNSETSQNWLIENEEPYASSADYIQWPSDIKFRFLKPKKLIRKGSNKKLAEQRKWYDIAVNSRGC